MIISDTKRFIFIHVPKAGGTTIRSVLKKYDTYDGIFSEKVGKLNNNKVDFTHLTLNSLKEYYPDIYGKLDSYWSFAFIRDPFERFRSSLAQYLFMYKGKMIRDLREEDIRNEAYKVITKLNKHNDENLPYNMIHFQKQCSYISNDGKKKIESIYRLDQIDQFISDFECRIGVNLHILNEDRKNQTMVYRNELIQKAVPKVLKYMKFLPVSLVSKLKKIAKKYLLKKTDSSALTLTDIENKFITKYYKDDISLYEELKYER